MAERPNRVFFPQACLDQWGVEGKIELSSSDVLVLAEGHRYEVSEVVRVVLEVTGAKDPHDIVGKVKSKADLEALGAEILENSMIIGDNAYDVVPGWAGDGGLLASLAPQSTDQASKDEAS